MEPELRQALEPLEQRMETLEQRMETLEQRMERLEQRMETLEQRMIGEIQASEARMREHVAGSVRASGEETRRHAAVLAEGLRADFRIATEAITPLYRRVDALEEHDEHTKQRVDLIESRVSVLERAGKTRRPRRR